MPQLVVFLDDGGVMNDNSRRASQWQHLVGEFFPPLLGGTYEAWSKANRTVADRLFDPENWRIRIQGVHDYVSFDRLYQVDWLGGMCELVGIAVPPEEECFELAHRAVASITRRVHAAFPGVVDVIRILHYQGYRLYTASGEPSIDLTGYLHGMGVYDCFRRLYGPDLINTFKAGPEYYERIFTDAGIMPARAVVVDDNPHAIHWAAQTGAQTILISHTTSPETRTMQCIRSLAELPEIIQLLDAQDQKE